MLDENSMEKKLTRQQLPPTNKSASDSGSAKREFPPVKNGPTLPRPISYSVQKSNVGGGGLGVQQQKYKNSPDRRPPSKTLSAPKISSHEVNEWDYEVDARIFGGGKKKNFNQLLSFTSNYQPSRQESGRNWRQSATTYRRPKQPSHSAIQDYNKERFLQANCQFIVVDSGNYTLNIADPDVLVEWDLVEELRLIDESVPTCPICLNPPVAGKITRCGHIFCWPCILHYLALSDETWRKCPICYESVHKKSLKSVVAIASKTYSVGSRVTMRLMRKEKGTTVVLPKSQWSAQHEQMLRLEDSNSQFAKILVISAEEVNNRILSRERVELETLLATEKNEPESCFILEALQYLKQREKDRLKAPLGCNNEKSVGDVTTTTETLSSEDVPIMQSIKVKESGDPVTFFLDAFDNVSELREVSEVDNQSVITDINELTGDNESCATVLGSNLSCSPTGSNNEKSYYFYQADDGQPVFLHSINAKCLTHEFGSLEYSPEVIGGRIVELERYVMTEELRLRFRYLAHLPLTTNFTVLELHLDRNIVQRDTLEHFADEFHRRHIARQRKAREEKKQTVQAQKWERAMLLDPKNYALYKNSDPADIPITTFVKSAQSEITCASAGDLTVAIHQTIPVALTVNDSAYPELGTARTISESESHGDETTNVTATELSQSPPSFAQMLRSGRSNKQIWPGAPVEVGQQPRWPATSIPQSTKPTGTKNSTAADSDAEGAAPDYQNTFGNAMEAALAGLNCGENAGNAGGGKKGKFKKGKGRLLFST